MERDNLALKTESMQEKLKTNNIDFDNKQFEQKSMAAAPTGDAAQKSTIIDQYKSKLTKAQKDLDSKIREQQEKDAKYNDLKASSDRNDKILKKHMDENLALKRQLKSGGGSSSTSTASSRTAVAESIPMKRDLKQMRAAKKEQSSEKL